jgi:hypothetical protein
VNSPTAADGIGSLQGFLALISRGSTRSIERASHLCANPSCILCGGLQLGLNVLDLNAEGLLKIPNALSANPHSEADAKLQGDVALIVAGTRLPL